MDCANGYMKNVLLIIGKNLLINDFLNSRGNGDFLKSVEQTCTDITSMGKIKNYCGDIFIVRYPTVIELKNVGTPDNPLFGSPYLVCYWVLTLIPDTEFVRLYFTKYVH